MMFRNEDPVALLNTAHLGLLECQCTLAVSADRAKECVYVCTCIYTYIHIYSVLYFYTHIYIFISLSLCLCLSCSVYIKIHESTSVPSILLQHSGFILVFFLTVGHSLSARNLTPASFNVCTYLVNPSIYNQSPVATTAPAPAWMLACGCSGSNMWCQLIPLQGSSINYSCTSWSGATPSPPQGHSLTHLDSGFCTITQ